MEAIEQSVAYNGYFITTQLWVSIAITMLDMTLPHRLEAIIIS
jgi:hypothetical protein